MLGPPSKEQTMEEMKHIDGVAPSAEDTAKLNEFVSWLVEHGFNGLVLIHKGGVGVSWLHEESADSIRHTLINSLGHIYDADENAGIDLAKGIAMAAKQLSE